MNNQKKFKNRLMLWRKARFTSPLSLREVPSPSGEGKLRSNRGEVFPIRENSWLRFLGVPSPAIGGVRRAQGKPWRLKASVISAALRLRSGQASVVNIRSILLSCPILPWRPIPRHRRGSTGSGHAWRFNPLLFFPATAPRPQPQASSPKPHSYRRASMGSSLEALLAG